MLLRAGAITRHQRRRCLSQALLELAHAGELSGHVPVAVRNDFGVRRLRSDRRRVEHSESEPVRRG
jgi:hypothetical protein